MTLIALAEHRWLPDQAIRFGIRRLLQERLAQQAKEHGTMGEELGADERFAEFLRQSDIAVETERANEQHYEVPASFFELALGRHLKYSSGLWGTDVQDLDDAEACMIRLSCERAELHDGMRVLDLGCGWGSLALWIAEKFPRCRVTGLSNSSAQREYIRRQCEQRGLKNVDLITANVATVDIDQQFDRIFSIEMLEHVRNYERLFARISTWLTANGRFFAHIFCHRKYAYPFETEGSKNWMGRTFFSGGIMPSYDLLLQFQDDLRLTNRWWIDGTHYAQTCEAWLRKLDRHSQRATDSLRLSNNPAPALIQLQQWRMFFMACAELFAYRSGSEWGVGHYCWERQPG